RVEVVRVAAEREAERGAQRLGGLPRRAEERTHEAYATDRAIPPDPRQRTGPCSTSQPEKDRLRLVPARVSGGDPVAGCLASELRKRVVPRLPRGSLEAQSANRPGERREPGTAKGNLERRGEARDAIGVLR